MTNARAYYNEFDRKAAAWLRELIKHGHIANGDVDERSIADVQGADLAGYTQCHFFAGIGGWSYALRLAGWDDSRPVWTGSCPCQPFSTAGKGKAEKDPRHLWPEFRRLIAECNPATAFGEQVASKAGRQWLAGVRLDMEALGYAVGAADLCAAGVGAPHIRQRLWFVADSDSKRRDTVSSVRVQDQQRDAEPRSAVGRVGNTVSTGLERLGGYGDRTTGRTLATQSIAEAGGAMRPGPTNGIWRDADWLACRDGKWRPVEPGTFPLAHGVSGRVGLLRGYGNAIVPQVAAEFIMAADQIFNNPKEGLQ